MPEKRGFFGPMKTVDTARASVEELADGRLRATIVHETMKGVTPAMLRWWFENIHTFTTWNGMDFDGPEVPVYRLWHPWDHIRVRWLREMRGADGRLTPGSVIWIEENILGRHEIRQRAYVTRFDDHAFNFELLVAGGLRIGVLDHEYEAVPGGSSFLTRMTVGPQLPGIGPLLRRALRARGIDRLARDWIVHNVEESGETEKFVPVLYEHAMRVV